MTDDLNYQILAQITENIQVLFDKMSDLERVVKRLENVELKQAVADVKLVRIANNMDKIATVLKQAKEDNEKGRQS